jgi:hypothetical protein
MRLAALILFLGVSAAPAVPQFEPVQAELMKSGTAFVNAWADYDSDGDLDLFVGFNGSANRLYRNERGLFTDVAAAVGLAESRAVRAAAWGDFDADGDPDLALGFAPGDKPILNIYRNEHNKFVELSYLLEFDSQSAAIRQLGWIDFDGDGDLDLFAAFRDKPNALFWNSNGRFSDIAPNAGLADPRKTVGAVWFDYDEDGDLDLYAANMDGDRNGLFRNERGRFTDVAEEAGLEWGGRAPLNPANGTVRPCVADVDGDGHLDLFTANYGPNGLFLNRGGGKFEDVSSAWGIAVDSRYDSCAFADFDNDGRIDLYVNGTVTGGTSYRDYLFRNTGTKFEDVTPDNIRALEADHGVQWADFDSDGDMDLALTGSQEKGMHLLLRNLLPAAEAARSLFVRPTDGRGRGVKQGAEVRMYSAGTRTLLATSLVDTGSGYTAQNDSPVHFGVGEQARVDVEVIFPQGGQRTVTAAKNVSARDLKAKPLTVRIR